jgi:hypothetical protein
MGDRANIKVTGMGDVFLYTHWDGSELPETLKSALVRGSSRWDDPAYLARIIFCEMVQSYEMESTGFGISGECGDGYDRVLTVDCSTQTVTWPNGYVLPFADYVKLRTATWAPPRRRSKSAPVFPEAGQ